MLLVIIKISLITVNLFIKKALVIGKILMAYTQNNLLTGGLKSILKLLGCAQTRNRVYISNTKRKMQKQGAE